MVNGNLRKGHAVVLGAGTMGGGIAALLASIGWRVHLLDQGEIAHRALERLQQSGRVLSTPRRDADYPRLCGDRFGLRARRRLGRGSHHRAD
jgi:glycine/D-amino acid oxidase-like deaminating enzyme